ncbi:MAG: fumarate hydratase [Syntrophaceae bacterium]|nr:fumarate hydratase [Syntrophaceae bacterium]
MNSEIKTNTKIRRIKAGKIIKAVKKLFIETNTTMGEDVVEAMQEAISHEESETGKQVLKKIIENAGVARRKKMPVCQDTGLAVVFEEMGQDVHITDEPLHAAIEEGVRQAYVEGNLRKSVCDQFTRENTTDNLPAFNSFSG